MTSPPVLGEHSLGTYDSSSTSGAPFQVLGLTFAPLSLSMERRMQTLAALTYMMLFMFMSPVTIVILAIIFFYSSYFWWLPLAYGYWMYKDWNTGEEGGRPRWSCCMRNWFLWKYFARYFPVKLIKTHELDSSQTYLLGSHPHGILSFGAFASFATDALRVRDLFPGMFPRLLVLNENFHMPGSRELALSFGLCGATRKGMENVLKEANGTAAVLVVGGAQEALNSDSRKINLIINKRKGFVKLALRFGRDLVPTFSFGENFIYSQMPNPQGSFLRRFQDWFLKHFAYALPAIYGRGIFQYNFGVVPYRHPINVVVGKPIKVDRVENPSREQIENLHDTYVKALKKLYDDYNPIYGDKNIELVIT